MRIGLRPAAAAAVACVLALATLGAASPRGGVAGRYGGTLTVGMTGGAPDALDPTTARTASAGEIFRTICEGLYETNSDLDIVPWLASAMPTISADRLTYTIPLRKGVLFNDGTQFNAQAVVASLQRDLTLPGSVAGGSLTSVDTVTASDPYTVVIHLKTRYSPLIAVLTGDAGIVMSPTQFAKLGTNFASDPVCVGPFMYDSSVPGSSYTVIKSPDYYDKLAVHLDKIVFTVEGDLAAATAALESGDIQAIDNVAPANLASIQQDANLQVLQQDTLGYSTIVINIGNKNGLTHLPYTNVGTPLASSPKLRQAFEEAIDRNTLAKVLSPGAQPGCTMVAPRSPWFDASIMCTPYDPADARKLVAASGISNPTVHLLTPNDATSLLVSQFVESEEKAVGITVVIDATDFATSQQEAFAGQYDAYLVGNTGSLDPSTNLNARFTTTGVSNYEGYSNPRIDLIVANELKASTGKARRKLLHVALGLLLSDRPFIWLYHPVDFAAFSKGLSGIELDASSFRIAFAQYS